MPGPGCSSRFAPRGPPPARAGFRETQAGPPVCLLVLENFLLLGTFRPRVRTPGRADASFQGPDLAFLSALLVGHVMRVLSSVFAAVTSEKFPEVLHSSLKTNANRKISFRHPLSVHLTLKLLWCVGIREIKTHPKPRSHMLPFYVFR